jgi:hypothetical protein
MPIAFTERRVLEIWQDSLQGRTDLVTEENEPVKIVYPGRLNDDRGADLRDAVIATRRGLLKGDIEIHVKASSWWAHRHHRDPVYNRVILHVVYRNDTGKVIELQNGLKVPTLALRDYIEDNNDPPLLPLTPCRSAVYRGNASLIGGILDKAGEQRFLAKVTHFKEAISQTGAGQALYGGIMTALGYSRNKESMAELACRMPLRRLEAATSDGVPDIEYLAQCQARLMGKAGLLPSQRKVQCQTDNHTEEWVDRLESAWAAGGETAGMSADDWRFFKVRPGNYPTRRIAAMSYLLLRFKEKGMRAGLEELFRETTADNGGRELEQALLVAPDGYWSRHLDFGLPGGGVIPALLGRERADEIVINVFLPFTFARGGVEGQTNLAEKALNIYRNYRAPAENTLEKHMRKQLGMGRYPVNTARRRQGLIHIYQTRCSQGRCDACPLGEVNITTV